MPSPVGHSLAALTVHAVIGGGSGRKRWIWLAALLLLANAADLDFIPGYFLGTPGDYHWGPTHSFAIAIVVGIAAGSILAASGIAPVRSVAILSCVSAYASHVILDMLIEHGAHPSPWFFHSTSIGLQALWPFTSERFMSVWPVFGMPPPSVARNPLAGLLRPEIFPIIGRELLVMMPALIVGRLLGRRMKTSAGEEPTVARNR